MPFRVVRHIPKACAIPSAGVHPIWAFGAVPEPPTAVGRTEACPKTSE